MPYIAAVAKTEFPDRISQQDVKECVSEMFESLPHTHRLLQAFDSTGIETRNFCQPVSYYSEAASFEQRNKTYIDTTTEYAIKAAQECIDKAGIAKERITDIVFVSTTGLATPSVDALIINKMQLNEHVNRTPVWGLGCAGGVAGLAKANVIAKANPDAIVLFIAAELCSLTFLKQDYSKSNFIGTSLFSDGIAACIVAGDNVASSREIGIVASQSKLYYNSLDVMGWDFTDSGFKVLFSKDIPTIVHQHIEADVTGFLAKQGLRLSDIKNFIFHPGGTKVIQAFIDALHIDRADLNKTISVMREHGNMSSVTVLYVLEQFMQQGFEDGYGLMLAMGPGFSSEMALLDMKKK